MPSIDDIEPALATGEVTIHRPGGDIALEVRGFTIREWAAIVKRFPAMEPVGDALMTPPEDGAEPPARSVTDRVNDILLDLSVACAVIAIGLNSPGDPEVEAKVEAKFSDLEIREIFDKVLSLSRPPAAGPLVGGANGGAPQPGHAAESPGRAEDGALSSQSTRSSGLDTSART